MMIKKTNVIDEILKHLENNIVSGNWKPGQKIDTEISLSEQLNVSRASIHSAIQQLVALGVLESHQGKGTYVKSIPVLEIQNRINIRTKTITMRKMMEFRIILEGEICMRIAPYISKEILDELEKCVEGLKTNKTNPSLTQQFDMQFHRILVMSTQNEIIIQSLDIIAKEMERVHMTYYSPTSIETTIYWHEKILEALRAGDGKAAKEALVLHLASAPNDPPFDSSSAEAAENSLFSVKKEN